MMSKEDGCKKTCFAKTFEVLQPSVLFPYFFNKDLF